MYLRVRGVHFTRRKILVRDGNGHQDSRFMPHRNPNGGRRTAGEGVPTACLFFRDGFQVVHGIFRSAAIGEAPGLRDQASCLNTRPTRRSILIVPVVLSNKW